MYWDLEIHSLGYSWKSEEHIKFSLQWSTFRIRRALPGSLDQTPTLPPIPDNARTHDTVLLCDRLTDDIAYALKYSRTSVGWYASALSTKTCRWFFLSMIESGRGPDNVPVLFLWSQLWRKHRQMCFALACSANASSPLLQPPSIGQSRCRLHRSIQWFDNSLSHSQGLCSPCVGFVVT